MFHKGQIIEIKIKDLAFGGKGIGLFTSSESDTEKTKDKKEFVVFVDGALPGQTVEAVISLKKRRHAEAKLVRILQRSHLEIDNNYQVVPGAPWAQLPIVKQQEFKQKQVFHLFDKFARIDLNSVWDEYVSSPINWAYRNKMEYSFGFTSENIVGEECINKKSTDKSKGEKIRKIWKHEGFGLGSKRRGQYWLVDNLEKPSGLFDESFESNLKKIRIWAEATGLPIYSSKNQTGFWRQLIVRRSFVDDKFLICIVTSPLDAFNKTNTLKSEFKDMCINCIGASRLAGVAWQETEILSDDPKRYLNREWLLGQDSMQEVINGLEFEVALDSFFQTNVKSAERLYDKALSYLDIQGKVLDLFSGTGTIAQLVAKKYPKVSVLGVEIVESAVKNAQVNSKKNSLDNVKFICEDVGKFLKNNTDIAPETSVILDPPRAGIVPKALKKLLAFQPREIVYISCNPATQARDAEVITNNGYKLQKYSLVDQFPHTAHVESVAKFKKIDK